MIKNNIGNEQAFGYVGKSFGNDRLALDNIMQIIEVLNTVKSDSG